MERNHWGDPGVGGRIILGWISGSGSLNLIGLAQDRGRRWAIVNAVMNFRVP
jgi:hypothetical protein